MFNVKVHGEINGRDITLIPSNGYEVSYINFEGAFKFKGMFCCLDNGYLLFRNIDDTSFEYVNCGDV